MHYKAVIFDLFGTLVGNISISKHQQSLYSMAKILDVPPESFASLWGETWPLRGTGRLSTTNANIIYICRKLLLERMYDKINEAALIYVEFIQQTLIPKTGVLATLKELKVRGYNVGLISDCSSEVPLLWPSTELKKLIDVAIFSCEVGIRKPSPQIYQIACEKMSVKPQECFYIGDGASQELSGAQMTGMTPILVCASEEENEDVLQLDVDLWNGQNISLVQDVLALLL